MDRLSMPMQANRFTQCFSHAVLPSKKAAEGIQLYAGIRPGPPRPGLRARAMRLTTFAGCVSTTQIFVGNPERFGYL